MAGIHSFTAVSSSAATVLVLGSMPGKRSLQMQEYYAHPQNAFWPIMAKLLGFDPGQLYADRIQCLQDAGVALWDVLAACERASSLDSDIVEASIVVNDFPVFLSEHPKIQHIYCNGAKSFQSYQRYVSPVLGAAHAKIPVTRLPSTSPAHASMNFQAKIHAWSIITKTGNVRNIQ